MTQWDSKFASMVERESALRSELAEIVEELQAVCSHEHSDGKSAFYAPNLICVICELPFVATVAPEDLE